MARSDRGARRALVGSALFAAALALPASAHAGGKIIEIGGGGDKTLGVATGDACSRLTCREFTFEDRTALGRVLSKLMGALPTPDPARYEQTGLKSLQGLGPILVGDDTWQAASFPANVIDTMALGYKDGAFPRILSLVYSFALKSDQERTQLGITERTHGGEEEMEIYDLRVQLTAYPTPFSPALLAKAGGFQLERTADTLVWEGKLPDNEKGSQQLTIVVGARSAKPADMDAKAGEPSRKTATLKAIRIDLRGPKADVQALAKKLDRRALAALVAPFANHDLPPPKKDKRKGGP